MTGRVASWHPSALQLATLPDRTLHEQFGPEVLEELAPTGSLRAAINYNNPLLARRNAGSGEITGLAVDLSRELARRAGVPLTIVPFDAAGKITASAPDNVWDIGYLAVDPRRANDIDFTAPHVELEGTYLVPAGSPLQRIEDVDRAGVRIAVTAESAYDLFLSRQLRHAQIVRAVNTPRSYRVAHRATARRGGRGQNSARSNCQTATRFARVERPFHDYFPQAMGVPKGRQAAARS